MHPALYARADEPSTKLCEEVMKPPDKTTSVWVSHADRGVTGIQYSISESSLLM
jgi:hypothetical protein